MYFLYSSQGRALGVLLALAIVVTGFDAAAQRGTGRAGMSSVSRGAHFAANAGRTTVNRHAQVNRNVNVHRNINVDVDHRDHYRPGTALAVAGAVAVTAAAIGSIAYAIPPSCVTVVRAGATYQQCGSTWYQPQYAGTSMTYVVVAPPG